METQSPFDTGKHTRLSRYVGIAALSSGRSIVWSGLTGFVGIFSSDVVRHLQTGVLDKSSETFGIFDAEGLLYDEDENDVLVDILEALARAAYRPTHYRLVLTGRCDLTCNYCIQAKIRKTMDAGISARVIDDFVKYVEIHSPQGEVEVLLIGGEPLYDVEAAVSAIRDIREAFSRRNRNTPFFRILTNGLRLGEFVDRIGSDASVVCGIQATADQDRTIHDAVKRDRLGNPTFDRVIAGVKRAVRAGIPVTLRMNIHYPDQIEPFLLACSELYNEIDPAKFAIFPSLVIQRPLALNHRSGTIEAISASFSRLLVEFYLWHYSKTGQIHSHHIPRPRWLNCYPKLGPASMLGSRGEVYSCTYSSPVSRNIDVEMQKAQTFPLNRSRCEVLANEVWDKTCQVCRFLAFCTGSCSLKTKVGQRFTADCASWFERFRTYGEIVERRYGG